MPWWKNAYEGWRRLPGYISAVALLGALFLNSPAYAQPPSVLSTGVWHKVGIVRSGVYRIDAAWLRKAGINPAAVDPRNLQLYGNGGSMLPRRNATPRPGDLIQNAIWVRGEEDGRFDDSDALYFYAEGPHVVDFDSTRTSYVHHINAYSDSSYYYLTVGTVPGLRVSPVASLSGTGPILDQFDDYWFHEQESVNLLQSGREWWGEYLGLTAQLRLSVELLGVVPGSPAVLHGAGIASAQVATRLRWRVNGQEVGEQTQGIVSTYRYDLKAQRSEKSYPFSVSSTPPATFAIQVDFDKNGQSSAQAYLDYAALQVKRQLRAYATQQIYRFAPSDRAAVTYLLKDVPADWQWWNIANPQRPQRTLPERTPDGTARFGASDGRTARSYVGFTPAQAFETPTGQKVVNQNLHGLAVPELVIVTPSAWRSEAERLAQFRQTHDGLNTVVVTTDQIYNEFSSGKPDPTALRDFLKMLYQQNPEQLKYLLLFGDATYDYKNRSGSQSVAQQQSWVPVYESRESLHPVFTYSSDDYFGFLDAQEGEWVETPAGDHLLDIGIGRLPVKTMQEARTVVDKLIHYGASPRTLGQWRNRIDFVADDGDGNIHQQHADLLAGQAGGHFLTQRLFVDAFPRTTSPEGTKAPALNQAIRQRVNEGALILNYTGHGGASGWAEEQILTLSDMQSVRGYDNLPLLLTATCEFGRYDDPALVSGAELMVLSPRGAAIGALTTTRPVFSSTNFFLNKAFYEALSASDRSVRLGDLMKATKNNSLSGSLNRNFALLGDPSMRLARAASEVAWEATPDTLSALRKVTLRGVIRPDSLSDPDATFNGTATITVYDKPVAFRTSGTGGSVAEYRELRNKLFEGKVAVQNGRFAASFVVPRNIDYRLGEGRVSVYAIRSDSLADASGQLGVWVGGASQILPDTKPPVVSAYLNDSTFRDGQAVPPSSVLVIKAFDESGINVSSLGLGQELTATLNDTLTYVLNDYFQNLTDTYQRGEVRFPLENLPPGTYTLQIKIWDNHTNSSSLTLRFIVESENSIKLSETTLFPNPFRDQLSFKIAHSRPQEDVELSLLITNLSGQILHTFKSVYYNSEPVIAEALDFGAADGLLSSGFTVYLYRMEIRSMKDQSTDRQTGKLLRIP
jgi:hypothetical protein